MALNLDNLRNDLEALCSRQKADVWWDPKQQQYRENSKTGFSHTSLLFTVRLFTDSDEDSPIMSYEKRFELLLKMVSKKVFDFFGYDADFVVTQHPGQMNERNVPVATPELMAQQLYLMRMRPLTCIASTCRIIVSKQLDLKESEDEQPLNHADKAERMMNSLIAIGAGKQLFVKAHSEPDPGSQQDPNRIMCLLYAEHDEQDMDAIAPPKARLRSFANAVKEKLEQAEDEGASTHLSIGAHRIPKRITPKDLSDLIAGGYGSSNRYVFRVGFDLFYP